ncbi:hypothetical protein ASE01_09380 [Nocardioides sp. Root190]|uniref:hypothetical protein n=1 Tax=Nocardioides sp. Root190 TaxID=1736488 RepID=UPI0006F3E522|nr:hypothetical protein [Nocardioides sp. Root190]KRB76971.1 hypothetical protein ASE01_09380 [Nocardioides sp. Root190]
MVTAVLATLLTSLGIVTVSAFGAPAAHAGPVCQRTFSSGQVDEPITDFGDEANPDAPGLAVSDIDVPEDGLVVADLNVTVTIQHTYARDLRLRLFGFEDTPGNARSYAVLADQAGPPGDDGDDYLATTFSDEAPTSITAASAPFTGTFSPQSALDDFDGHQGGHYSLRIDDLGAGDRGVLVAWSVSLTYASCDFDRDGVEDHRDKCPGTLGRTASGCPLVARTLTSTYRLGKFRGALSSRATGCEAARAVTIWKVRTGPDRRIGSATTRRDGTYVLTRARRAGVYYAAAPRVVVPGVAECAADVSARFRIR